MGLINLGAKKEKGTQLYLRDDVSFQFRKLEVEDSHLVEKNSKKEGIAAWMMRYSLLKRFDGFGKIGADKITVSYGRDVVLDLFKQLSEKEVPLEGEGLIKAFISQIAAATFYRHQHNAKSSLIMEKVTLYLGVVMIILAFCIALKAYR